MKAINIPGFYAEEALFKASGHYYTIASPNDRLSLAGITLATQVPRIPRHVVDCSTIPDSITCHECNSNGPGTFDCCKLGRPGEVCDCRNCPNPPFKPDPSIWKVAQAPGGVLSSAIGVR